MVDLAFPTRWQVAASADRGDLSDGAVTVAFTGAPPGAASRPSLYVEMSDGADTWIAELEWSGPAAGAKVASTWDPDVLICVAGGGLATRLDCRSQTLEPMSFESRQDPLVEYLVPLPDAGLILLVQNNSILALGPHGLAWSWSSAESGLGERLYDLEVSALDDGRVWVRGYDPATSSRHSVTVDPESGRSVLLAGGPRSLQRATVVRARLERLREPHVAPLSEFVERLRAAHPEAAIPWFDPADAGVNARLLVLRESADPTAAPGRGSGFASVDNNGQSAHALWELLSESAFDRRRDMVTWNVIPWYLGDGRHIESATDDEIEEARDSLVELVGLLGELRSVVLLGGAAAKAWRGAGLDAQLAVFEAPYPSPRALGATPRARDEIKRALVDARKAAGLRPAPAGLQMWNTPFAHLRESELGCDGLLWSDVEGRAGLLVAAPERPDGTEAPARVRRWLITFDGVEALRCHEESFPPRDPGAEAAVEHDASTLIIRDSHWVNVDLLGEGDLDHYVVTTAAFTIEIAARASPSVQALEPGLGTAEARAQLSAAVWGPG